MSLLVDHCIPFGVEGQLILLKMCLKAKEDKEDSLNRRQIMTMKVLLS